MPPALSPPDEAARLQALQSFAILDTSPVHSYQDIVERVADDCEVPMAAISLVDARRAWFKATCGLAIRAAPRGAAFCAYTILGDEPLLVEDTRTDQRFADNPLVCGAPGIRAYAGVPLITGRGMRIGALCAMDTRPRRLTHPQLRRLRWLAGRAMILLNIHMVVEQAASRATRLS